MKIALIGLLGLMLCTAVAAPAVYAAQNEAAPTQEVAQAPIVVMRDNFVSLSWRRTGGFAGVMLSAEVTGNVISRPMPRARNGAEGGGVPPAPNSRVFEMRGLSNKQLDQLVRELSDSNLPALAGNYHQEGMADGFNDTLVLTLSDENGNDQQFIIQNYGDKAPKSVSDFIAYFQEFVNKKFASRPTPL